MSTEFRVKTYGDEPTKMPKDLAKDMVFANKLLAIRRKARSETRQKVIGVSDAKIAKSVSSL